MVTTRNFARHLPNCSVVVLKMVILHVKKADESQFLYETTCQAKLAEITPEITRIYNARLKIDRLNYEIEELGKCGPALPPNMQGLTEDQINDLKLRDDWGEKCIPSGGYVETTDPLSRRNGKAPNEKMKDILDRTRQEAKADVSKTNVTANVCMTLEKVKDALDKMRGAVMIVYPMGLPPHDPIRMEFENEEDLSGTQASLDVLDEATTQLWWAGKELQRGKLLQDFIGKNEKTKLIVKIQRPGSGPPGREPVFTEDEKKQMMAHMYRKQEELKKIDADEDDNYMNSAWADQHSLQRQFQGVGNIKWRP